MTEADELNMSQLSLSSDGSQSEDWDRSMMVEQPSDTPDSRQTPRNSVIFPSGATADQPTPKGSASQRGKQKRSLTELLRLHAEKGTDCNLSTEEAARLGDVLGQWVCPVIAMVARH
jgi:hypothetical protein